MDTQEVQFTVQDHYYKFQEMLENGESLWEKVNLDKKKLYGSTQTMDFPLLHFKT